MARGWGSTTGAVVLLATVQLTGACTAGEPSGTPSDPVVSGSEAVEGLRFGECGDLIDPARFAQLPTERAQRLTFECGTLDVPLDHDNPAGEHLGVRVVRIRDSAQSDRIGALVMNPGRPGQSGFEYAPFWASWLPDEVLERFDVVTFDPRGVGFSGGFNCPAIPQDSEPEVLADLLSPEGYAFAVEVRRRRRRRASASWGRTGRRTSTPAPPRGTWTCCARPSATSG